MKNSGPGLPGFRVFKERTYHMLSYVIDRLDRLFQIILILFMVEITLVISIAVVSRYFMNSPVYWAEEVTRYSFVWATFLGAACAYRRNELVSMSVIVNALSPENKRRVLLVLEINPLLSARMRLTKS